VIENSSGVLPWAWLTAIGQAGGWVRINNNLHFTFPPSMSESDPQTQAAPPSFVKLAMRNMVRKGSKSLFHFSLTSIGLLGLMVGLAYLTR
jgi:hypothetical protein